MSNVYQFSHIFQFYSWQRQLAYARGNTEQGKQMDKYAMIYFAQANAENSPTYIKEQEQ